MQSLFSFPTHLFAMKLGDKDFGVLWDYFLAVFLRSGHRSHSGAMTEALQIKLTGQANLVIAAESLCSKIDFVLQAFTHAAAELISCLTMVLTTIFRSTLEAEATALATALFVGVNQVAHHAAALGHLARCVLSFVQTYPLRFVPLLEQLVAFLSDFYRERGSRWESFDLSGFFAVLTLLGDNLQSNDIDRFLAESSGKILAAKGNQLEFAHLASRFCPALLSRLPMPVLATLCGDARSKEELRAILGDTIGTTQIVRELPRRVLLGFPELTIFSALTASTATPRNEAEALLFKLFPRVTHSDQYQSAEDLISGAVTLNFLCFSAATSDEASREDGLRFLASAVDFVNEDFPRATPHSLRLIQWLKIAKKEDSLGCLGDWLFRSDDQSDPLFLETLRLLAGSVRAVETEDFFFANQAAILRCLRTERADSLCRFVFVFAAFRSASVQHTILQSAEFPALLRFVIAQKDATARVQQFLKLVLVPDVFLEQLFDFPAFILQSPFLLRLFERASTVFPPVCQQRLTELFLVAPTDAGARFVGRCVFVYSDFLRSHLPEIVSAFFSLSDPAFAGVLHCVTACPALASDLATAIPDALEGAQTCAELDRALQLCGAIPDRGSRAQAIVQIGALLAENRDGLSGPARLPPLDRLVRLLTDDGVAPHSTWVQVLFCSVVELDDVANPSVADFVGAYAAGAERAEVDQHIDAFVTALFAATNDGEVRKFVRLLAGIFATRGADAKPAFRAKFARHRPTIARWPADIRALGKGFL
jgi:hypothetical protein